MQEFTGDNLNQRITQRTATINPAAVMHGLHNVGQPLVVGDDGQIGLLVPQGPKPRPNIHPGIIAGAAVGGFIVLVTLVTLILCCVRRRQRERAAAGPFAPSSAAGTESYGGSGGYGGSVGGSSGASGVRKLKLIGRRSNGVSEGSEVDGGTPHSGAGPVAEAVVTPPGSSSYHSYGAGNACNGGYSSSGGSILLLNNNPLFNASQTQIRASVGDLKDFE